MICSNWVAYLRLKEADNVYQRIAENTEDFASAVDHIDKSQWQPLWNFCIADGDSEITLEDLTKCVKAAHLRDVRFLFSFRRYVRRYWDAIDQDGSGGVNYEEYIYNFVGAHAVTDARFIIKVDLMLSLTKY